MKSGQDAIDEFWSWFEEHLLDFNGLIDSRADFWDVALGKLQVIDKNLRFELSVPYSGIREFIITAEGQHEAFPLVDATVERVPKLSGWEFISLKPPMSFDFNTKYEGIEFDPKSIWFLPLDNSSRPKDLGVRIGVPNFNPESVRHIKNAVLIILDTALGERVMATEIQHVEVSELPEEPESEGYIELVELLEYIEWRKRKVQK